jgi:hypothetical protein
MTLFAKEKDNPRGTLSVYRLNVSIAGCPRKVEPLFSVGPFAITDQSE